MKKTSIKQLLIFLKNKVALLVILNLFLTGCGGQKILKTTTKNSITNFAPGLVNTVNLEVNTVFNNNFTELFFTRRIKESFIIHHSEYKNGKWQKPTPIFMFKDKIKRSVAIDPTITIDGKKMYFLGINPNDYAEKSPPDIYVSNKINGKWQKALKLPSHISTKKYVESYPIVVNDGSLYFTSNRPGGYGKRDLYRAQYLGRNRFAKPVNVGIPINDSNSSRSTYITPDEKYLITTKSHSGKGFSISKRKNGKWQPLKDLFLNKDFNQQWDYFCPYITPNRKHLFFTRKIGYTKEHKWDSVKNSEVQYIELDRQFFNR
ncbi:conserved hypothetical protein [Tenacibaculum sp. 190524A05c]|uniref:hypothetical protein n=1 Tax=Tenacibaculum platacis TaxID=3137852 RepID=UPI0031FAE3BD